MYDMCVLLIYKIINIGLNLYNAVIFHSSQ